MTKDDKIAELMAKAEPLRALPDDEAEIAGLRQIVDAINALRNGPDDEPEVAVEGADAPDEPVKRGPGRPRKAA